MTSLVLLALAPDAAELARRGAARRVDGAAVAVREIGPPLRVAIEAARTELGSVPLGVLARTRTEAIEAIEAGADEALVVGEGDDAGVQDLLDRTRLRGRARAADEQAKVDVAHAEKLAALGTLVAGVAHEINNPLAGLMLTLDVFPTQLKAASRVVEELARAREDGRGLGNDDVVRIAADASAFGKLADISDQVEHMKTLAEMILGVVKDLRVFARADESETPQVLHLPDVIDPVLRLVGRELSSNAVVERDYGTSIPVVVAPRGRLTQVLTNVLVNATHALREVVRDMHRVRVTLRADEDAIAISISDSGPGIPADALERIFDPFFTTKRFHLGTGLGLSISRNLIRKMGGDLLVESVFGEGATFIILVPRSTEEEIRAAYVKAREIPPLLASASRAAVLIVDEEGQVVRAYSRVLGRRFDLLVASDGQEAIEMLSSGSHADVVLADLGPSPLDGAYLHAWLTEHQPALARRVVFVSSEPDLARHRELVQKHGNEIVGKPASAAALIEAIDRASRR